MTEDITKSIALYHNLFLACLVLFLICLGVAAALFFILDIADVVGYLTGRKARKQIQKTERANEAGRSLGSSGGFFAEKTRHKGNAGNETEELDASEPQGMFEVERELLLIHTEEKI